ncbi:MAG TPA: sigma-70 family RNA polymerase sigma factor [Mycobacterium sp.]|nr:sigma-70 family RNA polymerase sigma factor [Mycobacterium sp.]
MDDDEWLAKRFEKHRPRLQAVAYRMLGSLADADDAVQDASLRLSQSGPDTIDDLGAWLTTVVARECLHILRSRRHRREESFESRLPDPIITPDEKTDPEQEAVLADSVGLALLVVLDHLSPAERMAFVLHDMFAVPFEEIARTVGRTPAAVRQLASRARRRVQAAEIPAPDSDRARQRQVVEAFFAASRAGDFAGLVEVLDREVVLRADLGSGQRPLVVHGAQSVAKWARSPRGAQVHPVLVNGAVGAVVAVNGRPFAVLAFTVVGGKIVEIDGIRDADRLSRIAAAAVTDM